MNTTVSPSEKERSTRFGVMCNGTTFPSWQADCLKKILALDNVEPALLIIDDDYSTLSSNWNNLTDLRKLLWHVYSFSTARLRSRAMRPIDMTSTLTQVPSMQCNVIKKGKFSQYFSDTDIAEIQKHDLDFILRFGFGILRGEILKAARFGIWSFHHSDEEKYRGSPPAFWEIYKGDPVTGATLQRLTDRLGGGIVLRKGFLKTVNTSHVRNRDAILFESTLWPAQVCADIQNGNTDYLDAPPSKTSAPIFHAPNNVHMMIFPLKLASNFIKLYRRLFFYDQWNIGVTEDPIHTFLIADSRPQVQWLPTPSSGKFSADPFGMRRDNALHILFEEYDYSTDKGWISTIGAQEKSFSPPRVVIDSPFHMSYPYLLQYNNEIYCIPETYEAREVSLYRANEFPDSWEKVAILIEDFAGLDSTIFQYEGHWWLLATDQDDGPHSKLKVWHAPDLLGPWHPHSANPVKVDVRSARPAGTPFMHDGQLYRPAQDCSQTYGGRIVLNRVTHLTPTEFREEPVVVIEPYREGPYPDGTHTISTAGDVAVVDGMKREFTLKSLSALAYKIKGIRTELSALLRRK